MVRAAALPAGLGVGVLAWVLAGGLAAERPQLDALEAQLSALKAQTPRRASPAAAPSSSNLLAGAPLLLVTSGPGAVSVPSVRLEGLSLTSRRAAALIAIGGGPAQWMAVGEGRDGVTLEAVLGDAVIVETLIGPLEVALGQASEGSGAVAAQTIVDELPPGVRPPLPPASAQP